MKRRQSHKALRTHGREAGFTLVEMLATVVLMGLVMAGLATVTAQWLPNWNRGLARVQRNEQLSIALDRLAADLSAAQFVSANRSSRRLLFQGGELGVVFVRTTVGPNSLPGLEIVKIAETADSRGPVLVRTRAPFVPLPTGDLAVDPIPFTDPVVLLRAPFRLAFAYAAPDGSWVTSWPNTSTLPAAVRFAVRLMTADGAVVAATATRIHTDMMAPAPEGNEPPPDEAPPTGPPGAGRPGAPP